MTSIQFLGSNPVIAKCLKPICLSIRAKKSASLDYNAYSIDNLLLWASIGFYSTYYEAIVKDAYEVDIVRLPKNNRMNSWKIFQRLQIGTSEQARAKTI